MAEAGTYNELQTRSLNVVVFSNNETPTALLSEITNAGHTATRVAGLGSESSSIDGYDLAIIDRHTTSSNFAWLLGETKPVVSLNPFVGDELDIADNSGGADPASQTIAVQSWIFANAPISTDVDDADTNESFAGVAGSVRRLVTDGSTLTTFGTVKTGEARKTSGTFAAPRVLIASVNAGATPDPATAWSAATRAAFAQSLLWTQDPDEHDAGPEPLNTTPGSITGTTTVGSTLTAVAGEWDDRSNGTGSSVFTWFVNDVSTDTGATFDTTGLSAGDEVYFVERRTNTGGHDADEDTQSSNTVTLTSEEDDPQMPPSSSSSDVIDFGYPFRLTFGIQGYAQYHLQAPSHYSPLFDVIDAIPEGSHLLWDTEPWIHASWAEYISESDENVTTLFNQYANALENLAPALLDKNITIYPYAAPVVLRQNYSVIRREQDDPLYIGWLERQLHILSIAESTGFLPALRNAGGKVAVNYYLPGSWQNHPSSPGWVRKLSSNLSGVLDDNNVPFIWMILPGGSNSPLFPPLLLALLESTVGRQSFWGGDTTKGFDEVIAFYTQSNSWWGLANNTSLLARWNGDANGDGDGDPYEIRSLVGSSWVGNADYEDPPTSKTSSGKAFVFDGSSYINTNFTELAGVAGTTLNFWYKFTEAPDDERVVPVGSYGGTGASAGSLSLEFNRGSSIYEEDDVVGFMRSGGTNDITTYTQNPIANLNDGDWHMITQIFTVEGSVGATYFDGVSVATNYSSLDIQTMNDLLHPLFIGAVNDEGTADLHFTGSIFDVRIYERALLLSEIADLYAGPEPLNLSVPTISGKFERGEIITCSPGSWDNFNNGSLSYTYQWQRDSGGNLEFSNIDGATSSSYTLTDSDLNNSVRCMVAATNSGGNNANFNTASDYLTFVDFAINARNLQTVPSLASDIVISENGYVILSGNYRMQGKKSRSKNISDYMNSLYRRFRR